MSEPVHELPDSVELGREEHRIQHAALDEVLDLLDRIPQADADGSVRAQVEAALRWGRGGDNDTGPLGDGSVTTGLTAVPRWMPGPI